jgi:hypothetical protein
MSARIPSAGSRRPRPAPYPLAGDIAVDGVWLSDLQHQVGEFEQAYDFASGELTSRFVFTARDRRGDLHGADLRQPRGPDPGLPGDWP